MPHVDQGFAPWRSHKFSNKFALVELLSSCLCRSSIITFLQPMINPCVIQAKQLREGQPSTPPYCGLCAGCPVNIGDLSVYGRHICFQALLLVMDGLSELLTQERS
eukprot:998517-Amphidinium_carterae.2